MCYGAVVEPERCWNCYANERREDFSRKIDQSEHNRTEEARHTWEGCESEIDFGLSGAILFDYRYVTIRDAVQPRTTVTAIPAKRYRVYALVEQATQQQRSRAIALKRLTSELEGYQTGN